MFRHIPGEGGEGLSQIANSSRKEQLFLCTGKGYVEYPKFLTKTLSLQPVRDLCPENTVFLNLRSAGNFTDSHSQIRMYHKIFPGFRPVEGTAQPRHKDHRKLQSFTFVNGHEPHHIRIFSGSICLPEIDLIGLKSFYIPDKMKQSPVAGLLKIHRLFHQHRKICQPPVPSRKRCRIAFVSGFLQYLLDQLMHRQIPHIPKFRIHFIKPV